MQEPDGSYVLILNYALLKNVFTYQELFSIIPNPDINGILNILVQSNSSNIDVSGVDGITIKGTGIFYLTFIVRENISARQDVKIIVVKNFDELLVGKDTNLVSSYFSSLENPNDLPVSAEPQNIFNVYAEYVTEKLAGNKHNYNLDYSKKILL